MQKVFGEVEAATKALEWQGLGLAFTVPGMMMKHWVAKPLDPQLRAVVDHYQTARDAAQRALAATTPAGRSYVQYWIGRLDFGIGYMQAIDALRAAAIADSKKDRGAALEHARKSLSLATEAVESYASVAHDRSDKGAIAVMNEYVIRPLRAKVAALSEPAKQK